MSQTKLHSKQIEQQVPQGFMLNGKIVPSVSSNNLTVAIKTLAGDNPSVSDPVQIRIGDTVREITSALSVTKNAGTNWCNSGSAELATKEIDYFVYLGYNATDGVTIGFARIPGANQYDDFSTTTTDEKYCAISTITNASSTDNYENIGRFAATLSAGAGYTWTVPTFSPSNLIQRPIFETSWLTWVPQLTNVTTPPTYTLEFLNIYKVTKDKLEYSCSWVNSSGGTAGAGGDIYTSLPFKISTDQITQINRGAIGNGISYEDSGTVDLVIVARRGANTFALMQSNATNISGNDQSSTSRFIAVTGRYKI